MVSIFWAKTYKLPHIEKYFENSWQILTDFFEYTPKFRPKIFILQSRKDIDNFMETKTEKWCKNGYIRQNIYLLNPKKYSQVTDREFDEARFKDSICHELSHFFYVQLSGNNKPTWLNEGVALTFGDQLKRRPKPDHFTNFLNFYQIHSANNHTVYEESGFVVDTLIKTQGKSRLLKLIQSLKSIKSDKEFNTLFKNIYGFEINYQNINKL